MHHVDAAAQELGAPWLGRPVMVLAMFGCSLVLTACFFAWVPRRHMWFTALGAGTLDAAAGPTSCRRRRLPRLVRKPSRVHQPAGQIAGPWPPS
ncbi:hypothetical protein [Streptomyces purpurascens]